jgi:hypothetical protein
MKVNADKVMAVLLSFLGMIESKSSSVLTKKSFLIPSVKTYGRQFCMIPC